MRCRVKPHPLVPVHLHAINCTYMRARWPECLVNFVHMFRCAYTRTHTRRHAHTHAQKCARTHACVRAGTCTHTRDMRCPLCSNAHQHHVSDGLSQAPAVPKAVPMPGLTADRFYPPVISAYFTMIDHDDQNPSCMHACQHVLARGWLVTHEQRCMSKQNSMQTCAVA